MAKQEFIVDVDFNQNQSISRVIENRTSAPLTAVAGQEYYDTTTNIAYFYNGTTWVPFYDAPNSAIVPVQAFNIDRYYTFGANTTSIYVSGLATGVTMGTSASVFFSGATVTKIPRLRFNSGATSNSTCGYRGANSGSGPTDFAIGTGFYAILNFTFGAEATLNSNSFLFAGLSGTLSDTLISSTSSVQSLLNIIGVGSAPADAFMSIFHNDGSGTATKVPLNPTFFPSNRTAGATNTKFFCLELYNAFGNTSLVTWRITAIDGIAQVGQQSGVITTDIPASTTLLSFWCGRTTGATASSVEMSISSLQGWTIY